LVSGTRRVLFSGGSDARYTRSGHILYTVGANMLAVPFDPKRMEVTGGGVPVIEGVMRALSVSGNAQVSLADNGTLVYIPAGEYGVAGMRRIALMDRDGKLNPLPLPAAPYYIPRLSPDGKRVALGTDDGREQIIWIYDLKSGGATARRLTFGPRAANPLWSLDGRYVIYRSEADGATGLFRQLADGTEPPVRLTTTERGETDVPVSIEPSGKMVVYDVVGGEGGPGVGATRMIALDGDSKPRLFAPFAQSIAVSPTFSPDGRWVAYTTRVERAAAIRQVFVQSYPDFKAKYQISAEGGVAPF
jgi:hypothetical protein